MNPTHIAVSPNYWGTGNTVDEAKASLKEFGGSWKQYAVWLLPKGAERGHVDQMGGLSWFWAEDADRTGVAEMVASRGVKK